MRKTSLQKKTQRVNLMRSLIYAQILFLLLFAGFFGSVPILSSIHYLTDVVTLILLIGVIRERKVLFYVKEQCILIPMIIYISVCLLSVALNGGSIALVLWAARNTYRFFVFYCACICYLEEEDLQKFVKFIVGLQIINFLLVIVEFVFLTVWPEYQTGWKQDMIGGIFGMRKGCNGALNIFLCMVFTAGIIRILEDAMSEKKWLYLCLSTVLCASLAEVKIFFLEMWFICLPCVLLLHKQKKLKQILKLLLILAVTCGTCVLLMHYMYPYSKGRFLNYLHYEEAHSVDAYRIGRLSAFRQINELFFGESLKYQWIGFGFGNCEYSRFGVFTSDFYKLYGDYNYRWFTHQMLYLETGILGVVSFACILGTASLQALAYVFKKREHWGLSLFACVMAGIFLINLIYNNNIRGDYAYIDYACLAIVPILVNREGKSNG